MLMNPTPLTKREQFCWDVIQQEKKRMLSCYNKANDKISKDKYWKAVLAIEHIEQRLKFKFQNS